MERCSRTPLHSPHERRAGKVLTALACAVALAGCGDKVTKNYYTEPGPESTKGALNINVNPPSASVVVTGPGGAKPAEVGNHLYTDLTPGQYTASATAPGFVAATNRINVVAGFTSSISVILQQIPTPVESPRAAYRDAAGVLVPLDGSLLQSGQFVFYAWLQDEPLVGIDPASLTDAIDADPGMPFESEQRETAPSFTQNLGAAFVGFKDATGVVRPVIGADVRWEIDQWYAGRVNSMQFGTSDDNRVGLGYGVFDDQADTRTNNARLETERFPLIAGAYPFYNQSGVGSPFTDGFTWVTLFSPDAKASARIVLVAVVDGAEVGKQILYKNFAPSPKIEITKTVNTDILNLDVAGGNVATWTITVKNVGEGDATNVVLNDFLKSGALGNYVLAGYPGTSDGAGGFDFTFDLPSSDAPPPPQNSQLLGNAWNFAIMANATVTNTGSSIINGNVGVSAGTAVTGFPPGIVLNGSIHNNDAMATAAQTSVTAAHDALAAIPCPGPDNTPPLTGTITPGVYCYGAAAALSGPVILDAQGDPSAEFVFKIGETLMTPVDSDVPVTLANGASACNVYWLVGSSATLNSSSAFVGNIIADASITTSAGANISGRALARSGAVTLSGASTINAPLNCVAAAGNSQTFTLTATVDAPGTYCNQAEIASFDSATSTIIPVDLNGQACFTAVKSQVSIVKDFVAADGTTSLGKALTVAKNVPAFLRVRVINSGGGDATGVNVTDVLDGGAKDAYVITVAPGATVPNADDGFTTAPDNAFDLPAPTPPATATTVTYLFTVQASEDGTYCDIGTVTADTGTLGNSSDRACLTVATPKLEITKVDGPKPLDPTKYLSVIPGGSYTSTIVVKNVGAATARGVIIRDLLGYDTIHNVQAIYVSSSLDGVSGTLANNLVSAKPVDILAGQSVTFTVVSRIPLAAVAGDYCDTASVTSSNAAPIGSVDDCVSVPPYAAIQTQLVDLNDPVAAGGSATYSSLLYVEALSNAGVKNNVLQYSFGHVGAFDENATGLFRVESTAVYLDSSPVRDPITGFVVSDSASPTAVRQTLDTDYTLVESTPGKQTLTMTPSVVMHPNTALIVVHVVTVPVGTAARLYNTSYIWTSLPDYDGAPTYTTTKSEPTTVIP